MTDRARLYLRKCPPAIRGQGGHKTVFRAACALVRGFELGEAETMSLLQEWNSGCQPPWSEAESMHKLRSAAKKGHPRTRGFLTAHNCQRLAWSSKPKFRPVIFQAATAAYPQLMGTGI